MMNTNNAPPAYVAAPQPVGQQQLFYGVAGILGIVSGFKKNSGVAIGYMVMSILACLAACCVIGFGAARIATINLHCRYPPYTSNGYDYYGNSSPHCELEAAINGVYSTLILLALAEFIVAMFGASMTCGPICNSGSATQTVIHYQTQPHVVVATQPQGLAFYNIAGQPQVAYPAQQGQYPQAQAPPPGEQQSQELIN
ncbi:uncharacterized protein LOC119742950 isoform X2 [Patiria miniata]|uniref:Membrane-spanning 4-domains subfamily A member 4A-like n=1 Tax=Patiria miniata TaxID=46514 RepID=A0A914A5F7_PATMI|nr:uncharacterized protein LOC119729931 isoform X2 [Patiria miniata]XP_038075161.1 uncharacterized protein LOC119742950 isoform X2 [Patiria miniata]